MVVSLAVPLTAWRQAEAFLPMAFNPCCSVTIGMELVTDPSILVLDEPTSGGGGMSGAGDSCGGEARL